MKYFDETAAYWGDSFEKIVLAGNNRLSVRSVKIFADGKPIATLATLERRHSNPSFLAGALRSGGAAVSPSDRLPLPQSPRLRC